jgi:hypothetical protein
MEYEWNTFTDDKLIKKAKEIRKTKLFDSVFFGILIGIALYSIYKNGFGLLTFLPLIYLPIARNNQLKRNSVQGELQKRNLDI